MKKYVVYDTQGEIVAFGQCDDSTIPSDQGLGTLLEGVDATCWTHHIIDGEPVAYTEQQATVKASKPSYPATWSNQSFAWTDSRTVEQARADQWEIVKAARDAEIYGTFAWNGLVFDADSDSQQRIQGAVQLATLAASAGQCFSIGWTLHDNTTSTLSGSDMINVGLALGVFVQSNFVKGVSLRAQINAASTLDEVKAVVWQ